MDFQAVAQTHHFRTHREKNGNFTTKVWYPGLHSGCVPTGSKYYPVRSRPTGSLSPTEKMWCNRCLDVGLPFPVSVGTFHIVSGSGEIGREKWTPSKPFKQYVSFSTQYAWKAVFLHWRKCINRVYFRHLSCRDCLASKMWELHNCPKDLSSTVRQCASLHFLSLVDTFVGHTMTAHEEIDCGSVSEIAGFHCGHLVEMIFHCKWLHSKDCKPSACFRIAKGWSKPSALRCEKTAVGWIFKQLLGCPTLGPTESKM